MAFLSRVVCVAALAALTLLSGASAGVNTPHSGWYSGNPLLGPNTLTDLVCAGNTCYASGEFGTLLKTTDGGETWTGIVTGLTVGLTKVRLAGDSPERVIIGGGCALRRSDDGGETFRRLLFSASEMSCDAAVTAFSFPTDSSGYILLADSRVLVTTDGGASFSRGAMVPGAEAADILCTGERTCFAAVTAAHVYRTTDGAGSWARVADFGSRGETFRSLEQADPSTLYVAGRGQAVMKSTDGGSTWTYRRAVNVAAHFRMFRCANALECVGTVDGGGLIIRTADGGVTWGALVPSGDFKFAVDFASGRRVIVAGALGSVEVSDDIGSTWRTTASRMRGDFSDLVAVSDRIAYAGGSRGVVARTTDGGQSWVNVSPPSETTIIGITGAAPARLYVLAEDGTLLRSDNGGQSYRTLSGYSGRPLAIHAVGEDAVLLIGPRGVVRSPDGGDTFRAVPAGAVRGRALRAVDPAGSAVVVYGPRAAALSRDAGVSWTAIRLPNARLVRDLDFATARVGYVLDTRGILWRTANGGRTWTVLRSLGTSGLYEVEFSDALNGYAIVRTFGSFRNLGLVLRTADGGRSWRPQLVSRKLLRRLATAGGNDYAVAADGELYATAAGGDAGAAQAITLSARPRTVSAKGAVTVSGRLAPAREGQIVVARLSAGRWVVQRATAGADGAFTTRWRVTRDAVFVAQVLGDADHAGAGTQPLAVRVRLRRKR